MCTKVVIPGVVWMDDLPSVLCYYLYECGVNGSIGFRGVYNCRCYWIWKRRAWSLGGNTLPWPCSRVWLRDRAPSPSPSSTRSVAITRTEHNSLWVERRTCVVWMSLYWSIGFAYFYHGSTYGRGRGRTLRCTLWCWEACYSRISGKKVMRFLSKCNIRFLGKCPASSGRH